MIEWVLKIVSRLMLILTVILHGLHHLKGGLSGQ